MGERLPKGFTSGKNIYLGVPELKAEFGSELFIENGAEMVLIKNNGDEVLLGTYDASIKAFIKHG